ncbi:unnamed protein product [Durusdinium trenchii]|uniref:Uncharacterized protein n=1 Tax=Durusdinium trenchii TaxID=1381693 RepID=A0ABP0KU33_9DINO
MQAVPMPIIYSTPSGLQVKGRRCLERMAFEDVLEDLQKHLTEELNRGGGSPVIQDLDLAQNMLSLEQFENLFFSLGVASAHVVRFRLFGCPTLDDEAMRIFAEYLRTSENAPAEMHLSDCAITTEGFQHLMSAIEETDLYPLVNANVPGEGLPLYLRLENNYIGQEAIQEKIDAGLIQTFDKQQGRRTGHQSGPKVNLLAKDTHFRQKQGPPPTPEALQQTSCEYVPRCQEGHSESHVPRGCCQASPSQPIAVPQHSHHQDGKRPSDRFPGDTRQAQADRAHHHFEDPAATAENSTATATAESFAATAEGEAATAKSQTPTAKGYAICAGTCLRIWMVSSRQDRNAWCSLPNAETETHSLRALTQKPRSLEGAWVRCCSWVATSRRRSRRRSRGWTIQWRRGLRGCQSCHILGRNTSMSNVVCPTSGTPRRATVFGRGLLAS